MPRSLQSLKAWRGASRTTARAGTSIAALSDDHPVILQPSALVHLTAFGAMEVSHETTTGIPDTDRSCVNGREDIGEVLDIHILKTDPLGLFKTGLARIDINRQSVEVTILGHTEQRRQCRIFWVKVVSDWPQHRDISIAPMCQRKDTHSRIGSAPPPPIYLPSVCPLWVEGGFGVVEDWDHLS